MVRTITAIAPLISQLVEQMREYVRQANRTGVADVTIEEAERVCHRRKRSLVPVSCASTLSSLRVKLGSIARRIAVRAAARPAITV